MTPIQGIGIAPKGFTRDVATRSPSPSSSSSSSSDVDTLIAFGDVVDELPLPAHLRLPPFIPRLPVDTCISQPQTPGSSDRPISSSPASSNPSVGSVSSLSSQKGFQ